MHHSGFINIVGLPNVGKSTLLNALIGERLAIISSKAQTTRNRLLGIVNSDEAQLIFSDTPGYINEPAYALHQAMNSYVHQSFEDADVLVLVTDRFQKIEDQSFLIAQMKQVAIPKFIAFNKVDLSNQQDLEQWKAIWSEQLPEAVFFPISATENFHIEELKKAIAPLLPEAPAYYDKDQITDRQMRYFAAEIVREQIFHLYSQEIPYSCQVECEDYKEQPEIDKIRCIIYVERDSQKNIVIGKGGSAITQVGKASRLKLEEWLGKKVFLDLFVKVRPNWRSNTDQLRSFGYSKGE
ncbi:MAG: GTPase Era [Chitinophagales bacterium]